MTALAKEGGEPFCASQMSLEIGAEAVFLCLPALAWTARSSPSDRLTGTLRRVPSYAEAEYMRATENEPLFF